MSQDWNDMSFENIAKLNTTEKIKAICSMVREKNDIEQSGKILKQLSEDNTKFWNTYLVSDFAIAALDILGIKKYDGNRYEIQRMIQSELNFS